MTDTNTNATTLDCGCARCDCEIERPCKENANYVIGGDFCCTETQTTTYGLKHTPETRQMVKQVQEYRPEREFNALAAEMGRPTAPDTIEVPNGTKRVETEDGVTETTEWVEVQFSIPHEMFERIEVSDPNIVQRDRDIAYTFTEEEEVEVTKTGIVCCDCCDPENDEILWGPDA